jgi:hypothetical protein
MLTYFKNIPRPRLVALVAASIAVIAAIVLILTQGPRGTLTLTVPKARSEVFIDDKRRVTTAEDNQTLSFKLAPGEHGIIIAHEGNWPWFKNVNMLADAELSFSAFSVPEDSNPGVMPKEHADFKRITDTIKAIKAPTRIAPSRSTDRNLALWVNPDNNGVYAEWHGEEDKLPSNFCEIELCDSILHFFTATTPVRNVTFLNNRTDVAIIATGNSIYLLEIIRSPSKNFQPLYVGTNPQFTVRDESSIYIYDNDKLMVVTF